MASVASASASGRPPKVEAESVENEPKEVPIMDKDTGNGVKKEEPGVASALASGAGQAPQIDLDYILHLEQIKNLQLIRAQMEPDLRLLRDKLPHIRTVRSFQVTHIDSPYDFYVKFIDVEYPVQLLDKRMQDYYNNPQNLEDMKYDPVFDVKLYLWLYNPPEGGRRWERVRVYARNRADRVCRVFLIDIGIKKVVFYEELYQLSQEFSKSEGRAIRVYLLDVVPVNGGTTWSEESKNAFTELALNKKFDGIGSNKFSEKDDSEFMEHCARYGVILFDKHSKYTLNAEMCRVGLAEGVGIAAGRYDIFEENNEYENRICDFDVSKLVAVLCNKQAAIAIGLKEPPEAAADIRKQIQVEFERESESKTGVQLAREVKERVARCICGTFLNPSCFYILMYEKIPLFEKMVDYIEGIWQHIGLVEDPSVIQAGTLLLVVRTDDPVQRVHRAMAREAPRGLKDGAAVNACFVKIFLIDLGRSLMVKVNTLRLLPKNLATIPPFAYRVHLDGKNLKPNTPAWSSTASMMCRKIFTKPIPAGLFYIWRHPRAATVELADIDGEVIFDAANKTWIAKPRVVRPGLTISEDTAKATAAIKANPLFGQFFKSVGIEVSLESVEPPTERFLSLKQTTLAELVKATGFAVDMNCRSDSALSS